MRKTIKALLALSVVSFGFSGFTTVNLRSIKTRTADLGRSIGDRQIVQKEFTYTDILSCNNAGSFFDGVHRVRFDEFKRSWSNNVIEKIQTDDGPVVRYAIRGNGTVYRDGKKLTDPSEIDKQLQKKKIFEAKCEMTRNGGSTEAVEPAHRVERQPHRLFGLLQKNI